MPRKYTYEEVKSMINSNEYELISKEYHNNKEKLEILHKPCNNIFHTSLVLFNKGYGCSYCSGKHQYTTEEFQNKINELTNNEYTLETPYVSTFKKIIFKHKTCGKIFPMRPNNFINGQRCPYCNGKYRYTIDDIINYLEERNYLLISANNYKNYKSRIKVKHLMCNKIFITTFDNFKNGKCRCPYCNMSQGEQLVAEYLDLHYIKYEYGYKFDDCKDIRSLPFDFYLEDYNLIIEFDGDQHIKPNHFHPDEKVNINKFKLTQKHDNIKNQYCEDKGINILRIPYKDIKNIDKILDKKLLVYVDDKNL